MARLDELPPELLLHIVSFLTREMILDGAVKADLVPDLSSVNALSRMNSVFHHTLNHTLYELCASVEFLGRLALVFAVEHNLEAAFDQLVAAGVSVDGEFRSKLSLMVDRPYGLLQVRYSLFQIAAGMGSSLIVSKLLRMCGSDVLEKVYARDGRDMSVLDYAVCEGRMETVRLLAPMAVLAASSSSPVAVDVSDELIQAHKAYLGQALAYSARPGPLDEKIAICEYLLSEGAAVNTLDINTHSALGHATDCDNLATMQILLAAGADPNLCDRYGIVPLFRIKSVPAAQALLDAGARLDATDDGGSNALAHLALESAEVFRFLLECGVDLNYADNYGRTPLHYACGEAGVEVIELILQFGATTVERADSKGRTPADRAMRMNRIKVVRLLEPLIQDPALKAKITEWLEEKGGLEDTGPTF